MQRSGNLIDGKSAGVVNRPAGAAKQAFLAAGLVVPAAWLLTACGSGEDLMSSVALPAEQSVGSVDGQPIAVPPEGDLQSGKLDVTPAQRSYLDALSAAGVQPSSELRALSIGSSVCQARAAGQSEQAVWEYIAPQVRSDVADARATYSQPAADVPVIDVTADYIRVATQRLC